MDSSDDFSATLLTPSHATPATEPRYAASLEQLQKLAAYEAGALLGRGGMGEVRLCRDLRMGRQIALKTATTRDHEQLERFVREAQVQGQLEHPSIVPVHELGVGPDGAPYFTMKRVRGETLQDVLRMLKAGEGDAATKYGHHRLLTAFLSVCQAVEYAHTHGWLHRDLKPANIMLGDFGEVYVLDWGLARQIDAAETRGDPLANFEPGPVGATTPGTLLGTPGYMAPEQTLGEPASVASDIYALGAVLFEVLSLQMLAVGTTTMELLLNTRGGADARVRTRVPELEVSPELEAIVIRATHKRAADRYPTVRALHDAVERVLAGERNLELRVELAGKHAEAARTAAEGVARHDGEELEQRKLALREVGLALALDPTHRTALTTLVNLLTTPPTTVPPEAREEIRRDHSKELRSSGRAATLAFLAVMLDLPLMLAMGVRNGWALAFSYLLTLGAAAASAYVGWWMKAPTSRSAIPSLVVSNLAVASCSMMLGPFVIVPALAAVNTVAFVIFLEKRYRRLAIWLGAATAVLPIVGTKVGWLPRAFDFISEGVNKGGLVLLPQAVNFHPMVTTTLLCFVSGGTVVIAAKVVGSVRDRFEQLQEKRVVDSWNLRQLIPPEGLPAAGEDSVSMKCKVL